jgi:hypothetical protein
LVKPLRIAFYIGCRSDVLSMLYLAFIFKEMVAGRMVEGWTSLMVVLLFIGAAQLSPLASSAKYWQDLRPNSRPPGLSRKA